MIMKAVESRNVITHQTRAFKSQLTVIMYVQCDYSEFHCRWPFLLFSFLGIPDDPCATFSLFANVMRSITSFHMNNAFNSIILSCPCLSVFNAVAAFFSYISSSDGLLPSVSRSGNKTNLHIVQNTKTIKSEKKGLIIECERIQFMSVRFGGSPNSI